MSNWLPLVLALLCAPLLSGIINRVKALFAGRKGRPLLQLYFDLFKLLRKGEVISQTTSGIFALGPSLYLAATLCALLFVPFGPLGAPFGFRGDFIFMTYLLAFGRFALILAALDTGSSFEGMGASREAAFSTLAEPVIFIAFLALSAGALPSLHSFLANASLQIWTMTRPELLLVPLVLFILLLVENCRIPVDDPNTHLELTMIHEVIILDHSGPNLAFILYASALKLWLFALLLVNVLVPDFHESQIEYLIILVAILLVASLVGLVESCVARLRLPLVPQLLGVAGILAALVLLLTLLR